ncbi:PQQ-dependent sugar dehydrogenase [Actinoalloteichus caeruleus]|uniref:PQQ-dependent sugar dehydrogenase n=1 Tax=Actinoalloteichus cyanogriseus TaxID=2893586 RepID=UPI0004AB8A84|nr:PQQ-dependent sugar dehydrogenase [Actinoalloteichus caeruleus]
MRFRRGTLGGVATTLLMVVAATGTVSAQQDPPDSGERQAQPEQVTTGLTVPWDIAFLPDGSPLVTERNNARVMRVVDGSVVEEQRILDAATDGIQDGVQGIAVSPDYETDGFVYVYYATAEDSRIARFRLGEQPEPILTGLPRAVYVNGGALAFGPDGYLYAGVPARYPHDPNGGYDEAQDLNSLRGKIVRLRPDGRPAPGNPFGTHVYSYGHRNVLGLAWDDGGRMFAVETGDHGADELNRVRAGANYGWPVCEGPCSDGRYTDPVVHWTPEEGTPAGLAHVRGTLYVTTLRGQRLWELPLSDGGEVTDRRALHAHEFGRLRAAAAAPDGSLWFGTSNTDQLGGAAPGSDRILRLG